MLGKCYFHPISILELILVPQPNVGSDLDNVSRVMSDTSFVLICAQQKRAAIENMARHDAHGYASAVFFCFEPDNISWKRIVARQFDIESTRIQTHSGLPLIETAQSFDPASEVSTPADYHAPNTRHIGPQTNSERSQKCNECRFIDGRQVEPEGVSGHRPMRDSVALETCRGVIAAQARRVKPILQSRY